MLTDWNFNMDEAPRDGRQVWILFEDNYADARYWGLNGWTKDIAWPVAQNIRLPRAIAFYLLPSPPETRDD